MTVSFLGKLGYMFYLYISLILLFTSFMIFLYFLGIYIYIRMLSRSEMKMGALVSTKSIQLVLTIGRLQE